MGSINGDVWILPAVAATGWILAWWGRQWMRWGVLAAAVVASVLCVVFGFLEPMSPARTAFPCRPSLFACEPQAPMGLIEAGVVGFVCCAVLTVVAAVVEAVVWIGSRSSALEGS